MKARRGGGQGVRLWQYTDTRMVTPQTVFLDQNHWIYLARAAYGRPQRPEHGSACQEIIRRVEADEIRLPLSIFHLIEHMRAESPERRARLAEVFERFSRGWFFAAWSDVLPIELKRSVLNAYGHLSPPPPSAVGRGYLFGVGPRNRQLLAENLRRLTLRDFAFLAAQPGALRDLLTFPNEDNRGRQNAVVSKSSADYAEATEALRAVRRAESAETCRRAQYAGYMMQFQEQIQATLASIGKSFEDFLALGAARMSEAWAAVPSLDVDCELTLYRDRQWTRAVEGNDVRDIAHLAVAIPYADVVVVERFWNRAISETSLGEKYSTAVYTDISDLVLTEQD